MNATLAIGNLLSGLVGLVVLVLGVRNMFWGNDPVFGMVILFAASIYFSPITALIKHRTGFQIPTFAKVFVGALIIWPRWAWASRSISLT